MQLINLFAAVVPSLASASPAVLAANGDLCAAASDCASCAAKLDDGCFWCYDKGGSCQAVGLSGLSGCANFSFVADDCTCQQYKSCHECATPKHVVSPACEWVDTETNLTLNGPAGLHKTFTLGTKLGCRVATMSSPFTGPGTVVHNASIGPLTIAIVQSPTEWWWGQCTASGPVAAGLVSTAALLMLCIAVGLMRCFCTRCCCRRRRTYTDRESLLLSVQGGVQGGVRPVNSTGTGA